MHLHRITRVTSWPNLALVSGHMMTEGVFFKRRYILSLTAGAFSHSHRWLEVCADFGQFQFLGNALLSLPLSLACHALERQAHLNIVARRPPHLPMPLQCFSTLNRFRSLSSVHCSAAAALPNVDVLWVNTLQLMMPDFTKFNFANYKSFLWKT